MNTNNENLEKIRHSCAHLLAQAALRLYPEAKLGIGVTTEYGFFQDFEFPIQIGVEDLSRIQTEMENIVREKLPFTQMFLPKEIALNTLLQRGQMYKAELLGDSDVDEVSFYKTGNEFLDLCRGPHVTNTTELRAFKLMGLSGAYWKSDENRPQLQRISGLAFRSMEELNSHLDKQQQLQHIDFRKTGNNLSYYVFHERSLLFTELGEEILTTLTNSVRASAEKSGFSAIGIPIINRDFEQKLNAVFEIKNRSYRTLPLHWYSVSVDVSEDGVLIQNKQLQNSHTMHIVTMARDVDYEIELTKHINALLELVQKFGMDYRLQVVTPDNENDFVRVIADNLRGRVISHTQIIDRNTKHVSLQVIAKDQFDRQWQLTEMQISYPAATQYTSREGELVPTLNIVSQLNLEQVIAFLLESEQGALPFWLSPRKSIIIPISEKHQEYAEKVSDTMEKLDLPTPIDDRAEKMEARVRDAERAKIPLILIIGDKELTSNTVSLRRGSGKEVGLVKLSELQNIIREIL